MISTILKGKGDCRYAILETGALGGYYGACLQRVGVEVHFLLHRNYKPLRVATAAGTDLPLISMLYRQLKFLDVKNRRFNSEHVRSEQ